MEHTFADRASSCASTSPGVCDLLAEVLARLEPPEGPPPELLDELLRGLEHVARRVEAAVLSVVGAAQRHQHFAAQGHRTVTSWQVAIVNGSRGVALARTRSARVVQRAPEVGSRLAAGEVGIEQVRALARVAANPRCGDRLFDTDEHWIPQLLHMAAALPLTDFRLVVDRWEQLADTDGTGGERAHRSRHVQLSIVGDTAVLKGRFDAATGVLLKAILDVFEQAEFSSGHPGRTPAQRRADALVAVFHHAVGGADAVKVTVNLVLDVDNLGRMLAGEPLNPGPSARCDTIDGWAVPPPVLLSAALAGRVRSVVTDRRGVVIQMGRRRRLFTGAVREAARLQGVRCVWPGCGVAFTEVDHMVGWFDGGHTDAHNAAPLCDWHNRWRFEHRYSVRRDDHGRFRIEPPTGSRRA